MGKRGQFEPLFFCGKRMTSASFLIFGTSSHLVSEQTGKRALRSETQDLPGKILVAQSTGKKGLF